MMADSSTVPNMEEKEKEKKNPRDDEPKGPGGSKEATGAKDKANDKQTGGKPRRKRYRNNNNGKTVKISKALSWALRHAAPDLGLTMGPDGYVPVDEILEHSHGRFRGMTVTDIQEVVQGNDKQRFAMTEKADGKLYIRANQGHSIKTIDPELLLTRIDPDELSQMTTIVHGTYKDPWERHIRTEGLSRMSRTHIHMAAGLPGEEKVISGMRASCDVFVYIDAASCARDGVEFYRSANGVILSAGVDGIIKPQYFAKVTDRSGTSLPL